MFASANLDYISHPPYIATIEQPDGSLKTEGFASLAEAVGFFFGEWCEDQADTWRSLLIDARGAGVVTYRPGANLQGWSITTEAAAMGRMIWPEEAEVFENLELLAIERAVLIGEAGVSDLVMALSEANDNADLMLDVRQLGYLSDDMLILDPTFNQGSFWSKWTPERLVKSDLDPAFGVGVADFTALPYHDGFFDAVVFDPPYKLNGTGGSHPSDERYRVANPYKSWQSKHQLIRDGITEAVRVTRRRGVVLVKCQDQVCSGAVRWQTREFAAHAESLGCRLKDMIHLRSYREQPEGRSQKHARRNYSTLLVLIVARKGK